MRARLLQGAGPEIQKNFVVDMKARSFFLCKFQKDTEMVGAGPGPRGPSSSQSLGEVKEPSPVQVQYGGWTGSQRTLIQPKLGGSKGSLTSPGTVRSRGGPDTDLIPDIRLKRVKDRTFSKNRRQRSCPLPRSLSIVDDTDFQGSNFSLSMKKHCTLYLDFSKGLNEVSNTVVSLGGFPQSRHTSVIQGGGGGEGRTSFSN